MNAAVKTLFLSVDVAVLNIYWKKCLCQYGCCSRMRSVCFFFGRRAKTWRHWRLFSVFHWLKLHLRYQLARPIQLFKNTVCVSAIKLDYCQHGCFSVSIVCVSVYAAVNLWLCQCGCCCFKQCVGVCATLKTLIVSIWMLLFYTVCQCGCSIKTVIVSTWMLLF